MRATRAIVHLENLRFNLRRLRGHVERASTAAHGTAPQMCVAVKADAYGHGSVQVAAVALQEGCTHLGVATVEEGATLRAGGIEAPILLYGLAADEEIEALVRNRLTPFVADRHYTELLSDAAHRLGASVAVHLKIDSGMGRIGCRPADAAAVAREIIAMRGVTLAGVATHFPLADGADNGPTREQTARFAAAVAAIRSAGIEPGIVHAANSGAVIGHPESWFDMLRPGISVYGYYPSDEQPRSLELKPVMELRSRISFVKKVEAGAPISYGMTYRAQRATTIATLPLGYADGYNRLLSNRGQVLVHERASGRSYRAPIAGRVCMDQFMIDVGPDARVQREDEVVLFGPDPAGPDAEEIAGLLGTIPYEVTCWVSKRVPRIYV
ncbi:MAG: alanine racemase [Spirochaetaceae bacterium]|nr:MAG: alanine racemase [Spirochaetaceae bacterium]